MVSLGVDGGVVVSGGTRIVVVLGFAALSDITPARLSSRLSTPSETSIQIVDRPKLLRTDQNSSSTSSSSVVLFSISFRQQLPGVPSHPLLFGKRKTVYRIPFFAFPRLYVIKRIRFVCIVMGLLSPLLLAVSPGQTQPQTPLNYLFCNRFGACCPRKSKECANSQLMFSGIAVNTESA